MKVVCIIQARMGSKRLPGKVMKEVLGKPLLEYQIDRVRRSRFIQELVIATSNNDLEQPIIDLCNRLSVAFFRGSEQDVLSRYWGAAKKYEATVVVRLTSDCPLMDPAIIDAIIAIFLSKRNQYDYVSNTIERTFPRGFDVEVFSMKALNEAHEKAISPSDREHVTPYFYLHPEKFNLGNVKNTIDLSHYRLTVDTEEDFQLIKNVIHYLHDKQVESAKLEEISSLLQEKPEWALINAHVEQKKLDDVI